MIDMTRYPSLALRTWRTGPWAANRLMRPSDRIEAVIRILAVVAVLAAVPICAAVGTARYTDAAVQIRDENAAKTAVAATIITDPVRTTATSMDVSADRFEAAVRWTHDGRPGEATTTVAASAHPGQQLTMWLAPDGRPTAAPLPADTAAMRGVGLGMATFVEICFATATLVWLTAWAFGIRHRAGWAREWRQISRPIGTP
ncbi:Rv1733c family protein [Nocardia africana]